jgi:predicted dehydrogenase
MTVLSAGPRRTQPRILLLGCGSIGRRHAQNLRALGVEQLIVFDLQTDRRDQLAREVDAETETTLDACWKRHPDAVLIALPTALHLPLALEAARRGCHLLIEKPLADRWQGVEELLSIAGQHELITLVGCNLRFHPGLRRIKCLLAEQAIGRVVAARIEVGQYLPDWHPWEDYRQSYSARRELGGGVILDAIHELDYARWLLGEITRVTCCAEKLSDLEIDTEDTAALLLQFQSGAMGEIHLDYIQRAYSRTCQIIGDQGTLHWDYSTGQVRFYSAHDQQWRVYAKPSEWQPNQMYVDEASHFLNCLDHTETPALDVFEAAQVLQLALAAKTAARERRWIDLGGNAWNPNPTL